LKRVFAKKLGLKRCFGQLMFKMVLNESIIDLDDQKMFNCVKNVFGEKPRWIVFWKIEELGRFEKNERI